MNLYTDLKNSLVGNPDIQDQQITAQFCFSRDLKLFDGHFPKNPILPGIVQIEMVKFIVEQNLGDRFLIRSIKKTKFTNLIHPEVPIHLKIGLTPSDNTILARGTLKTEDKIAGKINLLLERK
ncbi:MAG: hypothetical protein GY710_04490 [Desulfobacteraceae bacterium]|nr:hypothetical protein [Desulfobacteraceae bacterium]